MKNNIKNFAIDFFIENTNYEKNNIIHIKQIHHGYTNISFKLITDDNNTFQVRIGGSNDVVNRKNEYYILKTIKEENYIYIDQEGNAIKKWIDGINPIIDNSNVRETKELLSLLIPEIKKFHNSNIEDSKIIIHDYFSYYEITNFFNELDRKIYKNLCSKYKSLELVLSHNDINDKNIIFNKEKNKIYLIDFEWGRINNRYFDIANFIRETNLNLDYIDYIISLYNELDKNILLDFIYITTNFAYQWTFAMEENEKILNYRELMKKRLDVYRNIISIC